MRKLNSLGELQVRNTAGLFGDRPQTLVRGEKGLLHNRRQLEKVPYQHNVTPSKIKVRLLENLAQTTVDKVEGNNADHRLLVEEDVFHVLETNTDLGSALGRKVVHGAVGMRLNRKPEKGVNSNTVNSVSRHSSGCSTPDNLPVNATGSVKGSETCADKVEDEGLPRTPTAINLKEKLMLGVTTAISCVPVLINGQHLVVENQVVVATLLGVQAVEKRERKILDDIEVSLTTLFPIGKALREKVGKPANVPLPVFIKVDLSVAEYLDILNLRPLTRKLCGELSPVRARDLLVVGSLGVVLELVDVAILINPSIIILRMGRTVTPAVSVSFKEKLELPAQYSLKLTRKRVRVMQHQLDTTVVLPFRVVFGVNPLVSREVVEDPRLGMGAERSPGGTPVIRLGEEVEIGKVQHLLPLQILLVKLPDSHDLVMLSADHANLLRIERPAIDELENVTRNS